MYPGSGCGGIGAREHSHINVVDVAVERVRHGAGVLTNVYSVGAPVYTPEVRDRQSPWDEARDGPLAVTQLGEEPGPLKGLPTIVSETTSLLMVCPPLEADFMSG